MRVGAGQIRPTVGQAYLSVYIMLGSMNTPTHDHWLESVLPRHERLTSAVVSIIENLLREREIDFLAVTGRTKDKRSAIEKIKRKGYAEPSRQLTDLSGIRVVVFFESDVQRVAAMIEEAFSIDRPNSLDKDSLLSTNQFGYRSVHYVCDLGAKRSAVDEYRSLASLRFELQIRTVLQHAWAELAHDRNYKFSGKLPRELERKLYLYAGLLEIADRGFDETAKAIDSYADNLHARTSHGDLNLEVTSLSLDAFVRWWAQRNRYQLDSEFLKDDLSDLVRELREFGITNLSELDAIIPPQYAEISAKLNSYTTIYGVVRDWMLIKDWRRFMRDVGFSWVMDEDSILRHFLSIEEHEQMMQDFRFRQIEDEPDPDA